MMSSDNLGTISRALTVVQPWAHAIVHLGKDIEIALGSRPRLSSASALPAGPARSSAAAGR
jgi:hypothetical protein